MTAQTHSEIALGRRLRIGLTPTQLAVLGLLLFCNICSYSDRVILNLLVHPIQRSLEVGDTAISLLQGLAFALLYTIAIVPTGRFVDFANRGKLVGWGAAVWGVSTFISGATRHYWTIFLGRMGVGTGEATLQPAAYSLLADAFPKDRLASAMGVFHVGAYIGIGSGYILGGAVVLLVSQSHGMQLPGIGHVEPWQIAFMVAALPSLLASVLALRFLRDPRRIPQPRPEALTKSAEPFHVYLGSRAALLIPLLAACGLSSFMSVSGLSWTPTFFIRSYGMSAAQTGLTMGVIILFFSSAGAITGGRISDVLTAYGRQDGPIVAAIAGLCMTALTGAVMPLLSSKIAALACLAGREFFSVFSFPLAAAALQMTTPAIYRGRVSALYILVLSLTGNLLGPTVTALLNDHVFTSPSGVRYSLALIYGTMAPLAVLAFLIARRPFILRTRESTAAHAPAEIAV